MGRTFDNYSLEELLQFEKGKMPKDWLVFWVCIGYLQNPDDPGALGWMRRIYKATVASRDNFYSIKLALRLSDENPINEFIRFIDELSAGIQSKKYNEQDVLRAVAIRTLNMQMQKYKDPREMLEKSDQFFDNGQIIPLEIRNKLEQIRKMSFGEVSNLIEAVPLVDKLRHVLKSDNVRPYAELTEQSPADPAPQPTGGQETSAPVDSNRQIQKLPINLTLATTYRQFVDWFGQEYPEIKLKYHPNNLIELQFKNSIAYQAEFVTEQNGGSFKINGFCNCYDSGEWLQVFEQRCKNYFGVDAGQAGAAALPEKNIPEWAAILEKINFQDKTGWDTTLISLWNEGQDRDYISKRVHKVPQRVTNRISELRRILGEYGKKVLPYEEERKKQMIKTRYMA